MDPKAFNPGTNERDSCRPIHLLDLAYGLFGPGQITLGNTDTNQYFIGTYENVHVVQGCCLLNGAFGSAFRVLQSIACKRKLSPE